MPRKSLPSTGPMLPGFEMCESAERVISQPLTSWPAASLARTSATQGEEQGCQENEADYGLSSPVSFANFDLATSSWRTFQLSLLEGLTRYSERWPRSGTMRSGTVYRLPPLAPLINETGYSLWPTARADLGESGVCWTRAKVGDHRSNLEDFIAWVWLSEGNALESGLHVNPVWLEWFMGFLEGYTDLDERD